ncbi:MULTISPECIES: YceI family protein [Streptomyces]|uniref:YceI family protein n=1 Tax=Streptomyces caniscabiei TaxID=2746961 RepID=A0ABU4N4C1_9ACTN|nr:MULTISPECIES: YceI family protein [Streptomyces]MBE4740447.1 YceI family protein [Streptomyces caniscabiei]MBE4761258.1 YceI family protein [Streptomyces caniscabiei]MBE4773409.1 YceI family protein [Streptomyces caniscabiei]MBE4790144.1 YceI family protein [Streptomyces caniscabiei]MBE4799268.1 YceI family protein [Streptomyces caniscabiei]
MDTTGRAGRAGLTARVRTRDGWAVSHAVVTVTDMTGTQVLRAEADAEGRVHDPTPLAPGAYTVIVTAVGYMPTASSALVTDGGTSRSGEAESGGGRVEIGTVTLARLGGTELPPPGLWTVDPAHSSVAAVAQHLGISSVHGRFTDFSASVEIAPTPDEGTKSRVEAVIRAASIDTGNPTRDQHLRSPDFLDVERHPEITYVSTGLTPVGPDRWTVHGELGMRGVVRPVDLDLAYLGTGRDPWGGTRAAFRATTELRREDFAMNYNQVVQAGIAAIGTTLRVELDVQAVQDVRGRGA